MMITHTTAPLPNVHAKRVEMDMNDAMVVPYELAAGRSGWSSVEECRVRRNMSAMLSQNETRMSGSKGASEAQHGWFLIHFP